MAELLLLNGPNLDLLGSRQPELYGAQTLAEIERDLIARASDAGHRLSTFQSNAEEQLIERVHRCPHEAVEFILINPAAFTHTSIALRDALLAVDIPFVEVHLTNIYAREPFRRQSFYSDVAVGSIVGFGVQSYRLALQAACDYLDSAPR